MLKGFTKLLLPLLAVAASLWIAGPALSTERYLPGATDFTQPLPELEPLGTIKGTAHQDEDHGAELHRSAQRLFESQPIEAPGRFDFVGIAGRTEGYFLRAREDGGEWSEWVRVGDGDPLYTGGSEWVQVRALGSAPKGTLHYVNVSGDASPASGLLTDARQAVNSALITLSTPLASAPADAASPRPQMIGRGKWGANRRKDGCQPRSKPSYGKVKAAVIHHTVSSNDYSEQDAPGMVLGICRFHRNANGWDDIGYNAVVDRFGNIYKGRKGGMGKPVMGAQAQGFNHQTTGIAVLGNRSGFDPGAAEKRSINRFLAWKLEKHGVYAKGSTRLRSGGGSTNRHERGTRIRVRKIFGHGTTNHTACPGSNLAPQVRKIQRRVLRRQKKKGFDYEENKPGAEGNPDGGGTAPDGDGVLIPTEPGPAEPTPGEGVPADGESDA